MGLSRRAFALSLAAACTLPPGARAAAPHTLRLAAYLAPASHTVSRIITPWMESVLAETGDRLAFDVFSGGSLGRSAYTQFDLLRTGMAEVAFAQPTYTTGQFPQLQILQVPFLTQSATEASLVAWRLCDRGLVSGFENVKLLGVWTAEPGLLFTRVPVSGFGDLANLKIRAAGRLEGDFIESLGARAESMHPADVYEALNRRTIDGTVQGWVAVQTFQTWRASTHVITAPFGVVSFALMMNLEAWNRLPRDLQDIIDSKSGQAIAVLGGTSYDRRVIEIEQRMRAESGLTFVEPQPDDMAQVRASSQRLVDAWIARTERGRETYDAALDILAALRAKERAA